MQNSLYKLFEHKCVLEVCVHINPIMIKKTPSGFLNPYFKIFCTGRSHNSGLTSLSYLRPTLSELRELSSIVLTLVQGKTRCLWLSDWGVLLLDVIMNIAVVIDSRHLSRWRYRELMLLLFWRECADPDLPKCIYVCANHSISSFIYRRSECKGFYESLQIAFPNNVLVSFAAEV